MWSYQITPTSDYLAHYGVKGRSGKAGAGLYYRNGELTEAGKQHYYGNGSGNSRRGELNSIAKSLSKSKSIDKTSSKQHKNTETLNVSKTGMYGKMKTGREVKRYLKEHAAINNQSAKDSKDKQYKSEVKSINKEYKILAKKYAHKKLTDVDRVNLQKAQDVIDQKYCDVTTAAFRRSFGR